MGLLLIWFTWAPSFQLHTVQMCKIFEFDFWFIDLFNQSCYPEVQAPRDANCSSDLKIALWVIYNRTFNQVADFKHRGLDMQNK